MADIIETIDGQLTRLENAKRDIVTALENQGVKVPEGASLDEFPALINEIITGVSTEELSKILEDYALASELDKVDQSVVDHENRISKLEDVIAGDSNDKNFVTIGTDQTITGTKEFTQPVKVASWVNAETEQYAELSKDALTVTQMYHSDGDMSENGYHVRYEVDGIRAGYQEVNVFLKFPEGESTDYVTTGTIATQEYVQDQLKNIDPGVDGTDSFVRYDELSKTLENYATQEELTKTDTVVSDHEIRITKLEENGGSGSGGGEVTQEEFDKYANEVSNLIGRVSDIENDYVCLGDFDKLEARVTDIENNAGGSNKPSGSNEFSHVSVNCIFSTDTFTIAEYYPDGIRAMSDVGDEFWLEFPPRFGAEIIATEEYVQEEIKKSLDSGIGSGSGASCNCPEITINDYQPEKLNFYAPEYSGEWGQVPMFNPEVPETEWVWLSDWAPTRSEFEELEQRIADQDTYIEKLERRIAALEDIINKL